MHRGRRNFLRLLAVDDGVKARIIQREGASGRKKFAQLVTLEGDKERDKEERTMLTELARTAIRDWNFRKTCETIGIHRGLAIGSLGSLRATSCGRR